MNKLYAPLAPAADALRRHWPEYLMEAAELGMFMGVGVLVRCPAVSSGVTARVCPAGSRPKSHHRAGHGDDRCVHRLFAIGKTIRCALQSGRHTDLLATGPRWPVGCAFLCGWTVPWRIAGVGLAALVAGRWLSHDSVRYAVTTPGAAGILVAWGTEFVLAFGLMTTVLLASNTPKYARYTGVFTAALVAAYIPRRRPCLA